MPVADPVNNPLTPVQERLRRLVRKWENAEGAQKQDLYNRIDRVVRNHPKVADFAKNLGFSIQQGPPAPEQPPGPSGEQGGDKSKGGKPKPPKGDGDLLPGQRGKHYNLVRFNGRMYVVYRVKLPGVDRYVNTAWRVEQPDKHGFEESDGRQITKGQFTDLPVFGESGEIVRRNGGNKHPFKKWLEDIEATYGGTSLIHNKEAFGVLVSGFLENEDAAITEAKLRKTEWYQKRTASQREWEMVLTDAEREKRLDQTHQTLISYLDEMYGPDEKWRDHIDGEQVQNWAEKIASGKWDDPGAAMDWWRQREERKARRVKGTNAWLNWTEQSREMRLIGNRPEETFEKVREQAANFLGYKWMPSAGKQTDPEFGTMWFWANALSSGRRSEHDYMDWLRKRKETLHPYLDPDETWIERATGYKNIAEDILGSPLSFNDRLFADFTKRDAQGQPIEKSAMSSWDFEKAVKEDPRFRFSKSAITEASRFADLLGSTMTGAR